MMTRGWTPRACMLGCALMSTTVLGADAPVADNLDDGLLVAGNGYRLIEEGPLRETTLYTTGETMNAPTEIVWKPWCGSDLNEMSPAEFRTMVNEIRARRDEPKLPVRVVDSTIGGVPANAAGGGGGGLNLIFNVSNAPSQAALDSIAVCESIIEGYFKDPVSVVISVDFQPIGALGSTGSAVFPAVSYSTVRSSLQADTDQDDYIESFLPAGSSVPVRYNGFSTTVTNETTIRVNTATYEASIGSTGGTDAFITISTTVNWDYDESNGTPGFQFGFQSTFIHEVGHALGFTSATDLGAPIMEILDLYRFQLSDGAGDYNPDNESEFQVRPRLVDLNAPNDDHNSNFFRPDGTDQEYRMADGSPNQASHWREFLNPIGIMDPTGAPGESFFPDFYQESDLEALDAIGWDFAPEDAVVALPFCDDFTSTTIDPNNWSGIDGATVNNLGDGEPSSPNALNLNFVDEVRSAIMDTSDFDTVRVSFWWQAGGTTTLPETNEDLFAEYRDVNGAWVTLAQYPGGQGVNPFTFASFDLTDADGAAHESFRIRFRVTTGGGADNWFVDDVKVIGINPPDNDRCQFAGQIFEGDTAFDTSNATDEGPVEVCGNIDGDVWFFHVAQCDGEVTVSVCDAEWDGRIAIYGITCPGANENTAIVCNDDTCGDGPTVTYPVIAGQFNRIRVGSVDGSTGPATISVSCGPVGSPPCPWDCVPEGGNGTINIDDLLEAINSFGQPDPACDNAPDNGDGTFGNGVVNIDDILGIINNFGDCLS